MLIAAVPADSFTASPTTTATAAASQEIDIIRSHSRRLPGFTISVDDTGQVHVLSENGRHIRDAQLPANLTSMFFMSAQMAAPSITSMQAQPCNQAEQTGGQTYLRFNGVLSPDLSCNASGVLGILWGIAKQVMSMLGVNNYLGGLGSIK